MVIKINKQKLIMEEVEQFDDISIDDLGEGEQATYPYSRPFSHRARSFPHLIPSTPRH